MASSPTLTTPLEWNRDHNPIMSPEDSAARWFEKKTIYKSLVMRDTEQHIFGSFLGDAKNEQKATLGWLRLFFFHFTHNFWV